MAYAKETICIQSGWKPKNGEPRVLPIYQSTTFKYESSEQMGRLFDLEESGYFYSRLANPTNDCVAQKICELEGGAAAMLTGSGQAAKLLCRFQYLRGGRPCRIIVHRIRRNLQSAGGYHEKNGRILYCRRPRMQITIRSARRSSPIPNVLWRNLWQIPRWLCWILKNSPVRRMHIMYR